MKKVPKNLPLRSVPCYHTFPEYLDGIAAQFSERTALTWFTRGQERCTYTYKELTDRVSSLRRALCARGLNGKHIALVGENSADWIVSFLAVASCGAVAVCVDMEQPDACIREMVTSSDATAIFLSPAYVPICQPLLDKGELHHAILMGDAVEDKRIESMEDLCAEGRFLPDSEDDTCVKISPNQTAEIVFTSGTTSEPKMVMLSQDAIMSNVFGACCFVDLQSSVFTSLPFYHSYGLNSSVLASLCQGVNLFINGDLKTAMRDFRLSDAETMFTVPLIVEAIHNQMWLSAERKGKAKQLKKLIRICTVYKQLGLTPKTKAISEMREKIVGNLSLFICGGAHLSKEISEEFECFGIKVLQGYGITECSPLISVNRNELRKMGSAGLPLPNCEIKLVDGEFWVRGVSVMQGYYKSPEDTALAMEDGWFKTGDLGYFDKDGFIYLDGRKKNLIVFKNGKKVSPEKLENLVKPIPLVKEVVISGTINGVSADDVKLTASILPDIERAEGMSSYEILELLQKEINSINSSLPTYQQIQMISIREKEFSKTTTKKIKRHYS